MVGLCIFANFHNVAFKEDYKTVKPTRLNLTLIGTIFKEKGALAIIRSSNSKSKVYQKEFFYGFFNDYSNREFCFYVVFLYQYNQT
jgi:hypothetical protein